MEATGFVSIDFWEQPHRMFRIQGLEIEFHGSLGDLGPNSAFRMNL